MKKLWIWIKDNLMEVIDSISFLSELLWRTLLVVLAMGTLGTLGLSSFALMTTGILGLFWIVYPAMTRLKDYLEKQSLQRAFDKENGDQ